MPRPGLPNGLTCRMIIAFVGTIVVAMLVLIAVVPGLARAHQLAALEDRLANEAQLVADYVQTQFELERSGQIDALAKRLGRTTESRITIIALDGTVLGESHQDLQQVGNQSARREVQGALVKGRGVDLYYSPSVGYDMLYVAVPIVHDAAIAGTARTALPLGEVNRLVADLTRAIWLSALGGSLLALLVAILAARAITRPLGQLARGARILSYDPLRDSGNWLRGTALSRGPSEIVQLGETLMRMAKTIRESLRRVEVERDRLDAVLANMADGVALIDAGGRVTRLNKAAERLLSARGLSPAGQTTAEVFRDHQLIELVDAVRTGIGPSAIQTRFLEWTSPPQFLRAAASQLRVGEASQTLLVLQDLTDLRRLETVRRDFVANVSHELRTPISAIKAMAETLQDGAVDDREAAGDFLGRIQQEIDGVHRLVEELLELSRLESGRVETILRPIDPARMIDGAVQRMAAMAERAKVNITVQLPSELPTIEADAERIGQVFVNLIHNAIKFTPQGGTIALQAAVEQNEVVISVADTGVGVAAEDLPRIFERFYKADQARSSGGTGLGLAIAKHTVQLHSGRIWAESAGPGRGTTLSISLPLAKLDPR